MYGQRPVTVKAAKVNGFDWHRGSAREMRMLWFMRELGCGWLSLHDITQHGGCTWKTARHGIADCLRHRSVEYVRVGKRWKFRINRTGLSMLKAVEDMADESFDKAVRKCAEFRKKHGID